MQRAEQFTHSGASYYEDAAPYDDEATAARRRLINAPAMTWREPSGPARSAPLTRGAPAAETVDCSCLVLGSLMRAFVATMSFRLSPADFKGP